MTDAIALSCAPSRGSSRSSTRSSRCRSRTSARSSPSTASRAAHDLLWITVAMVGARSLAMALNRLIDAELDARNPRTATRELPAGRLSRAQVLALLRRSRCSCSWSRSGSSTRSCAGSGRSRSRRSSSTRTSSASRGSATSGSAPSTGSRRSARGSRSPGAAVGGVGARRRRRVLGRGLRPLLLRCFDLDVDRREGLHSWATRFGVRGVFAGARVLHVLTVAFLAAAGLGLDVGAFYWLGVARRRGAARLRALARPPRRPAPARRGVLHR